MVIFCYFKQILTIVLFIFLVLKEVHEYSHHEIQGHFRLLIFYESIISHRFLYKLTFLYKLQLNEPKKPLTWNCLDVKEVNSSTKNCFRIYWKHLCACQWFLPWLCSLLAANKILFNKHILCWKIIFNNRIAMFLGFFYNI